MSTSSSAYDYSTRDLFESAHTDFRQSVREFVRRHVKPHIERWEIDKIVDRETWLELGKQGLLGIEIDDSLGGGGSEDFRYRVVIHEELAMVGAGSLVAGLSVHDDIALHYLADLGTEMQRKRLVPASCAGEKIGAIAMTEPGAGSDLQGIRTSAVRDGDDWILNGSKTFITNGIRADWVIVVARTDPNAGGRGLTLFLVETGVEGFTRGRQLEKIGLHGQDTAELFFSDVHLTDADILGTEGEGFFHLMNQLPRERMSAAVSAICAARAALKWTIDYTGERKVFGRPVSDLQNTRFVLAELDADLRVGEAYLDACVHRLNAGTLTTADAARAKMWSTEMQVRTVDKCVQLHGGYGYMREYPIARAYVDARIQTIYGGSTEIMKVIIARDLLGKESGS